MNDPASAVDSWAFYDEVRHTNSTAETNVKYKFINASEMEYIFEHHAPDKWFMKQHVKRYIPTMLAGVKNEIGGKNPMKCNPMEIFNLLVTEQSLAISTERINRNCAKNKLKGLSSARVRDCLIAWMLCTVYGQPVCDLFNDDFQLLFARPKAVSEEEMRTVLRGLQGDADRFKFLHEATGLWVHEGQYDRELASLEVLVAEI